MQRKIWLVPAVAVIASLSAAAPASATFPGARGTLTYQCGFSVCIGDPSDPDSTQQILTKGAYPKYSPDGTEIAYSQGPQNDHIAVMNADGSGQHAITTARQGQFDFFPAWSPDGTKIAFSREFTQGDTVHEQLRVVNVASGGDGTLLKEFNAGRFMNTEWNPDGSTIATEHVIAQQDDLMLVNPSSGATTPLRTTSSRFTYPGGRRLSWEPDGKLLAYAPRNGTSVLLMKPDGSVTGSLTLGTGHPVGGVSFTPDGAHLMIQDCSTATVSDCPSTTDYIKQIPDPEADFDPTEPQQEQVPGPAPTDASIATFDYQPQKQPIIFVHGFAGASFACGIDDLWPPNPAAAGADLLDMRLADDGISNAPGTCGATPTGIVNRFYGSDVYQSTIDFLQKLKDEDDVPYHVFYWDWRKDPRRELLALQTMIQDALNQPEQKAQGVKQVTLMGHSMGGLLIRAYIDDAGRAKKVARAVTVGTPYWGSPKAIFPLAAGVESPSFSTLDPILPNDAFREFARNLTGMYYLYPSEHYGPWLSVQGRTPSPFDRTALVDYVGNVLHGNAALLNQALDAHNQVFDGFKRNGVDYRAFVGTGLNTVGGVKFLPGPKGQASAVDINWVNGDSTVPARSGTQGPIGTSDPLGDDIPISYVCGISHVPLPGSPAVDNPLRDFLTTGAPPRKTKDICPNEGEEIHFTGLELPDAPQKVRPESKRDTPPTLEEAETAGAIQLIDLPGEPVAVTDDSNPVTIAQHVDGARLSVDPIHGETTGATHYYGPVTGTLTIQTASDGAITVLDDGKPVQPRTKPEPGDPGQGEGGPAKRKLSIAYSARKHAFTGKLRSKVAACVKHQKVVVRKQHPGKDPKVGTDRTSRGGAYSVHAQAPNGHYYAQARRSATCAAAKSKPISL